MTIILQTTVPFPDGVFFYCVIISLPPPGGQPPPPAGDQLERLRAQGARFVSLSFPTISGADSNGAVIHYRPLPGQDRPARTPNPPRNPPPSVVGALLRGCG